MRFRVTAVHSGDEAGRLWSAWFKYERDLRDENNLDLRSEYGWQRLVEEDC